MSYLQIYVLIYWPSVTELLSHVTIVSSRMNRSRSASACQAEGRRSEELLFALIHKSCNLQSAPFMTAAIGVRRKHECLSIVCLLHEHRCNHKPSCFAVGDQAYLLVNYRPLRYYRPTLHCTFMKDCHDNYNISSEITISVIVTTTK